MVSEESVLGVLEHPALEMSDAKNECGMLTEQWNEGRVQKTAKVQRWTVGEKGRYREDRSEDAFNMKKCPTCSLTRFHLRIPARWFRIELQISWPSRGAA